jgi:hypothetical protein
LALFRNSKIDIWVESNVINCKLTTIFGSTPNLVTREGPNSPRQFSEKIYIMLKKTLSDKSVKDLRQPSIERFQKLNLNNMLYPKDKFEKEVHIESVPFIREHGRESEIQVCYNSTAMVLFLIPITFLVPMMNHSKETSI